MKNVYCLQQSAHYNLNPAQGEGLPAQALGLDEARQGLGAVFEDAVDGLLGQLLLPDHVQDLHEVGIA